MPLLEWTGWTRLGGEEPSTNHVALWKAAGIDLGGFHLDATFAAFVERFGNPYRFIPAQAELHHKHWLAAKVATGSAAFARTVPGGLTSNRNASLNAALASADTALAEEVQYFQASPEDRRKPVPEGALQEHGAARFTTSCGKAVRLVSLQIELSCIGILDGEYWAIRANVLGELPSTLDS